MQVSWMFLITTSAPPLTSDVLKGMTIGTSKLSDVITLAVGYMFIFSLILLLYFGVVALNLGFSLWCVVGGLISAHFGCLGNQWIKELNSFRSLHWVFGIFYSKFKTLLCIFSCDLLHTSSKLLVEVWHSWFRFYMLILNF